MIRMKRRARFTRNLSVFVIILSLVAASRAGETVFPGKTWTRSTPEEQGLDPAPLAEIDALMKKAQANGVLIRNGYLVAEWNHAGPRETRIDIQSCGKSINSMMLGVAVTDGVIPSVDTKVKDVWPEFDAGKYSDQITFRHLVTMTSGIANTIYGGQFPNYGIVFPPGKMSRYHNNQPWEISRALTYLYGRPLKDVLRERILDPIDAGELVWNDYGEVKAKNGETIPVSEGFGCHRMTASDLARIGLLYLNGGVWNGKRLLSADYVKESLTDIPQPLIDYRSEARWHGQTAQDRADDVATLRYGFAWWSRTFYEKDEWYMSGNGSQFCFLFPKENMVMTKINSWQNEVQVNHQEFYPLVKKAVRR